MITIKQILHNWLMENKYDGLCNQEIECGCKCSDFMPCNTPLPDCVPAYRSKEGDGEHAFLMTPEKPLHPKLAEPVTDAKKRCCSDKWICKLFIAQECTREKDTDCPYGVKWERQPAKIKLQSATEKAERSCENCGKKDCREVGRIQSAPDFGCWKPKPASEGQPVGEYKVTDYTSPTRLTHILQDINTRITAIERKLEQEKMIQK